VLSFDVSVPRRDFVVAVALDVAPGERCSVIGPSGAGKSTLVDALSGLVRPASGEVRLGDALLSSTDPPRWTPPEARPIAVVRQDAPLFPHLDLGANLAFGRASQDARELGPLLDALGLGDLPSSTPVQTLSGGQARRAAIVRALARPGTKAALADEPFAGSDPAMRRRIGAALTDWAERHEAPLVVVAHELEDALGLADRIVVLVDGHVAQIGPPDEVVRKPETRAVAELAGYRSFVAAPGGRGEWLALHPDRAILGARPELGPVLPATVKAAWPRPFGSGLELALDGSVVLCHVDTDRPPAPGSEVSVTFVDAPVVRR
jgi:molybdate transport system ATP-binding protein